MAFCRTCKYWSNFGGNYPITGVCLLAGSSEGYPNMPDTLAWAKDGRDDQAKLLVRDSFGCIQHEEIDNG